MDLATTGQTKAAMAGTIKSILLPQVPVSWGSWLTSQPEATACVGISCQSRPPLCNVFDPAHVIVQVRGWSGPRGSGHIWTTPTQVLFVLLILFTRRHRVIGQLL